ncbi:MAG: exodeoxyribonuclease VII large subunit [Chryseolinea sp.]
MAENVSDKTVFSLLEVTNSIKKVIQERYKRTFWVKAEMNKLNHYSYSGHSYPELVEKKNGKVVSQMRASLWKEDFLRINNNFLKTLKEPLKDGILILFSASVTFDPVHGLALRIIDIDPVFSLGELEREKLETIDKLKQDGTFNLNRSLQLPLLPMRIAMISVETSKGYSDFINVLSNHSAGYKFFCFLFPALLQGDRSVDSILNQLRRVKRVREHFDVVAIIRGGGGDVGLSSYNNFMLSSEIARFPIPVLTGIGHSTNETVAEMVAFKNAITPTELADYLIQKVHDFSVPLDRAQVIVAEKSRRLIAEQLVNFNSSIRHFRSAARNSLTKSGSHIQVLGKEVSKSSFFLLRRCGDQQKEALRQLTRSVAGSLASGKGLLQSIEKTVSLVDPIHIMRRGFTITILNGKAVKNAADVSAGDTLRTYTAEGEIISTVIK